MPQLIFRIIEPSGAARDIQVEDGLTIGRARDNRCVVGDETVGLHHLQVLNDNGRLVIEDLGSSNGTHVKEGPVLRRGQRHIVHDGLAFRMGKTLVTATEGRLAGGGDAPTVSMSSEVEETLPAGRRRQVTDDEDARTVRRGAAPRAPAEPPPETEGTVRRGTPGLVTPPMTAGQVAPEDLGATVRKPASSPPPAAPTEDDRVTFKQPTLPPKVVTPRPEAPPPPKEAAPVPDPPDTPKPETPSTADEDDARWLEVLKRLRPRLVVVGKGMKKIHDIEGARLIVGRSADAGCYLEHPTVSAEHARITFNGKTFAVETLSQTNVTQVAGNQLRTGEKLFLTPPVKISFGAIESLFLVDDEEEAPRIEAASALAAKQLVKEGKVTGAQLNEAEQRAKSDRRQLGEMLLFQTGLKIDDWMRAFDGARERRGSDVNPWLVTLVVILLVALGVLAYLMWVRPR
jgi:pSer/pThr/pTyr-binding forkhead associated (FHA) protein